jgi:sterol desaturase/sphingolipid hydroxylase (fatty acid hydroxylase superfamily)
MYDLDQMLSLQHNPVAFAIPFFVLTIVLEIAALTWLDDDGVVRGEKPRTGYLSRDFWTSLSMGLGSIFWLTVFKVATFFLYQWVYLNLAPVQWSTHSWVYWVAAMLALDLAFYCTHRFVHEHNIGWAAHQSHHSSEYMNFGTALRQKWNPWFDLFFFLPLPLMGFAPWTLYVCFSVNLIWQFFTHTELIGKLPRWFEFVFNTPSHHRVHHGSDEIYLDRNYAGILIIWDRMFGSFQEEIQRPTYGLTYKVETYNTLKLEYAAFGAILRQVRTAGSWRERWGYLWGPPGWAPDPAREPEQQSVA